MTKTEYVTYPIRLRIVILSSRCHLALGWA